MSDVSCSSIHSPAQHCLGPSQNCQEKEIRCKGGVGVGRSWITFFGELWHWFRPPLPPPPLRQVSLFGQHWTLWTAPNWPWLLCTRIFMSFQDMIYPQTGAPLSLWIKESLFRLRPLPHAHIHMFNSRHSLGRYEHREYSDKKKKLSAPILVRARPEFPQNDKNLKLFGTNYPTLKQLLLSLSTVQRVSLFCLFLPLSGSLTRYLSQRMLQFLWRAV